MNCRKVRRLLSVRREWTAEDRALAEAHLGVCSACEAVSREYELMDRRLGRLPEPVTAAVSLAGIRAQMLVGAQSMRTEPRTWRTRALRGGVLLAVLFFVVFAVAVWQSQDDSAVLMPDLPAIRSSGLTPETAKTLDSQSTSPSPTPTLGVVVSDTMESPAALRIYGIQVQMLDQPTEPIVGAVDELGFGWVKQQVQWEDFESSKEVYAWSSLDTMVETADAAGIAVLWSVINAPDWARGGQDLSVGGPPNDPQDLADFLGAAASRYCGRSLQAIEIWDEQNVHYKWGNLEIDPGAYVELLGASYEAIKTACPDIIVVSGGLTPTGAPPPQAMDDVDYLGGMYQNGLQDYCDVIGIHLPAFNLPPDADWQTYQNPSASFLWPFEQRHRSWSFQGAARAYQRVFEQYDNDPRPVWVTEFGWAVGNAPPEGWEYAADNTDQERAEYTLRAYEMAREWSWIEAMFLFNLNFSVVNPDSPSALWSIVGPAWERSATFEAIVGLPQ